MYNLETDLKIMKALKVSQLRHPLAITDKGELSILLRYGETEYRFMLDSVPCEDDVNAQLFKLMPYVFSK